MQNKLQATYIFVFLVVVSILYQNCGSDMVGAHRAAANSEASSNSLDSGSPGGSGGSSGNGTSSGGSGGSIGNGTTSGGSGGSIGNGTTSGGGSTTAGTTGGDTTGGGATSSGGTNGGGTTGMKEVSIAKSILITNPQVLNDIVSDIDFGFLLGKVYNYSRNVVVPQLNNANPKAKTHGEFVRRIFEGPYEEQVAHSKVPLAQRLGDLPKTDRYLNHVFKVWKGANQLDALRSSDALRGGPFRLLAIANLMENAGNIDNRGTNTASAEPRALGEMHLVYGLIDKEYEKAGKVYPQTWVLAYRLPPIKKVNNVYKNAENDLSQDALMKNSAEWKKQMKLWAEFWGELSQLEMGTAQYKNHLRKIFDIVTDGINFINLRNNTKITDDEFELREWYMLGPNQQFIPRKPRAEPYACLSGSEELGVVVSHYWDQNRNDLDHFTYDVPATKIPPTDASVNGFTIPRDNENDLFRSKNLKRWSTCEKERSKMPYEMDGQGFNDPDPRIMFSAPFARVKGDGKIWKLPNGFKEAQRHSFAIRTCSGCHSQEGAAKGFHIFPRLANEESKLSPFMTGTGANKFTHGGVEYSYDQLRDRLKWHNKAQKEEAVLFDSLQRKDKTGE